jgi:hypothetical protein
MSLEDRGAGTAGGIPREGKHNCGRAAQRQGVLQRLGAHQAGGEWARRQPV